MDDIAINKRAIVARCIARIHEEYGGDFAAWSSNLTRQDSVILNIQRACEATIDLAMHRVRLHRLGIPQDSRDAFDLLRRHGELSGELCERLKRMVGFRNIAVHDYQGMHLGIVRSIIERHLGDLQAFAEAG